MRAVIFVLIGVVCIKHQGYAQPSVTYIHKGERIELQQVTDVIASRVLSNAVIAAAQRDFEQHFDVIKQAGRRTKELLVSKAGVAPSIAAASISRIERIQEAQRLRVFQPKGGGETLLIEFPEIIVQYAHGTSAHDAEQHLRQYSQRVHATDIPGRYLVEIPTARSTTDIANEIARRRITPPIVEYAQPNYRMIMPASLDAGSACIAPVRAAGSEVPNDAFFDVQWAFRPFPAGATVSPINIAKAWTVTRGHQDIRVAVLDEGIDLDHPDLQGRIIDSWDAVLRQTGAKAQDDADHGTACAGIIAALDNNGLGITGVAPGVKLLPIRIAVRGSDGRWVSDSDTITRGINKAVQMGAHVISASWGVDSNAPMADVERAVERAYRNGRSGRGAVVVVAAGNTRLDSAATREFGDPVQFPATMARSTPVIAVGAHSPCDELKSRSSCDNEPFWASNEGPEITVLAPGVKIATLTNRALGLQSPYNLCFRGTSSAAPFVAGVAALVLSQDSMLSAEQVKARLVQSADTITTSAGRAYKRINACRAVSTAACAVAALSSRN